MIRTCRTVAFLAILACAACSGGGTSPPAEPLDAPSVTASWPLELALSVQVDQESLLAYGERWLGLADDGAWRPPGEPPPGVAAPIAERWRHEDRLALGILAHLDLSVLCRLGSEPGAFGSEVPEGWAVADRACRALDAEEAARHSARLREEAGAPVVELPPPPVADTVAGLLAPAVDRRVEIGGETLRYRFVLPVQWDRAAALLPADPPSSGLAARVGTSRWGDGLPGAADLLAADGPDERRLARLEREAEALVARWKASIEDRPDPAPELDAASRALLLGWVRRALYRDLGLAELEAGRPEVAVALLEEATGAAARPEPGPGMDPLLLSAFASARCQAGEVQGAAELLTRIAIQPGWHWVGALAEGVARVAVLPSATASEVRR